MKKINKLFAILFAVLGVQSLAAQTDVTSTYLTNAGFDDESGWITASVVSGTINATTGWKFASSGDTWYYGGAVNYGSSLTVNDVTPPATNPDGNAEGGALGLSAGWGCTVTYSQEVTLPAGVYTLSYAAYNANTSATQANNYIGFTSSSITAYGTTTNFIAGTWSEESISFVLTAETTGNISVGMGAISGGSGANAKLFVDGVALTYKPFSDVTETTPVDLTSMGGGDWTSQSGSVTAGGVTYVSERFSWANSALLSGEVLSKSITNLPVGVYTVEVYSASSSTSGRDNTSYVVTDGDEQYTSVTANGNSIAVPTYNRTAISGDLPYYTFEDLKITEGTLNLAVNVNVVAPNWLLAKVKSITFLGPDKSLYEEAFVTKYSTLSSLNAEEYPSAFVSKINSLVTTYSVDATGLTLSELEAANIAMDEVLNVHEAVAASYASYNTLLATCESIHTNSTEFVEGAQTTFSSAIEAAKTSVAEAETADAVNTVYNTLEAARQTYVVSAYPINDITFDLTFKANTAWANITGSYNAGGVAMKERYAAQPWTGAVGTTSYTDLPNGMYDVQLHFNASACEWSFTSDITDGDENTSVTANNIVIKAPVYKLKSVSSPGTITLSDVMVKNQTIDIAINNDVLGANWILVAHKSLTFKSRLPVNEQQAIVTELLAEANALASEVMNSTVKTDLDEAISNADAESENQDALDAMIAALKEIIPVAEASVTDYEKIAAYIAKAKVFDESLVSEYETAYSNATYTTDDVEKVRQELNVATADYVAATFKNEIALTDWSAESNAMWSTSGEHWDGTTGDGCTTYYDANGTNTTHTLSKTVTLTPGTYVFRGAGRSNTNTKLSLSISIDGIEPAIFNAKGNTGYGIDVEGNATFDESATYARDDAGQGWEWEFIKFTLSEDTEVTLTATCQTTGWGWASFANNGLWMDDATYVAAYGSAIDAPLAEAKALVNTFPMGETENAALETAIAACDAQATTPAELNAQVEGLTTAVANANAWVATYNTAKADLVAALERFEADYNDAENGALDYMNKSRWETVITEVGEAAEAKDNQTDYTVLTAATADLVAALDAATVSVNEYAALKKAIDEANTLVNGINWGEGVFQKPLSAKESLTTTEAQAVYDAAEADGEDVTSVAEELTAAQDITLNAPAADDVFYLTVATEGHSKLGNSVVASLGATGNNNPTGYGFSAATNALNPRRRVFTFTQVAGNLYNISVVVNGETVYLTYGSLNGSAASWATQQIQGTTDKENAGEFKIEASPAVDGAFRIFNTVDNNYIDCQSGGALYTDTSISNEDFALAEETTVSVDVNITAENMWSTCVLPFGVDALPEGLRAFKSYELTEGSIVLEEVTALNAYTPYILYANEGCADTLSGTVGLDDIVSVAKDDIALYGAIEQQTITAGYILQNQGSGMKFHKITDGAEFTIPEGKCWLEVPETFAVGTQSVTLKFKGGANGIEGVELDANVLIKAADGIYTIDGKRVENMQKGQIYVVGGKKVKY